MKYLVIGTGAVGGYFGGRLQQAGQEIIFAARGESLRVLSERGLTLCCEGKRANLFPISAIDDFTAAGSVDYVLICVKAWQVEEIAQKLPLLRKDHTCFLTLQNGVEPAHIVAQYVGSEQVFGGLVRGFFQLEAPGSVRHVGVQPSIIFGPLNQKPSLQSDQLLNCLIKAGVHAEMSDNIETALWEKFLLVTSISGVGAVTRSAIGEIRDYAPTWRMVQTAMEEIVMVARACKICLSDDVVARTLAFVESFPYDSTSSMQRDILNGLPSELEAQTGAVVRLGREVSVPTPLNQYIYDSLILQERRARRIHQHDDLKQTQRS